jgi:hypothetical protein
LEDGRLILTDLLDTASLDADSNRTLQAEYDALLQQKERRQIQAEAVGSCLDALAALELPQIAYTDSLWNTAVDHVTVFADDRLVFHFKNGSEVEVNVCK